MQAARDWRRKDLVPGTAVVSMVGRSETGGISVLSLEQQTSIGSTLRSFARLKVSVFSATTDPEAYMLGTQIVAALKCAHLNVDDHSGKAFPGTGTAEITGVRINSWLTKDFAETLAKALRDLGHLQNVSVYEDKGGPVGTGANRSPSLNVFVVAKPLPLLTNGAAKACPDQAKH